MNRSTIQSKCMHFLVISLLVISSMHSYGQDTPVPGKYPKLTRLTTWNYLYGEKVIREKEMHKVLLSLNDPQLTAYVKQAKKSKEVRFIGLLAIPFGIASFYCLNRAVDPFGTHPVETRRYFGGSLALFGAASICMGTSIAFTIRQKNKNNLAIGFYREKYMNN
jgi:hypothetical protein